MSKSFTLARQILPIAVLFTWMATAGTSVAHAQANTTILSFSQPPTQVENIYAVTMNQVQYVSTKTYTPTGQYIDVIGRYDLSVTVNTVTGYASVLYTSKAVGGGAAYMYSTTKTVPNGYTYVYQSWQQTTTAGGGTTWTKVGPQGQAIAQ